MTPVPATLGGADGDGSAGAVLAGVGLEEQ